MPGFVWTAPAYFMERTARSPEMGMGLTGALSSMVGADHYELLGCKAKNINWCLGAHDIVPVIPLSCFTFAHGGKMELTVGANPHSLLGGKVNLDRICKECVHEEIKGLWNKKKFQYVELLDFC